MNSSEANPFLQEQPEANPFLRGQPEVNPFLRTVHGDELLEGARTLEAVVGGADTRPATSSLIDDFASKIKGLRIGSILALVAGCLLGVGALISLFIVSAACAGALAITALVVLLVSLSCFIAMKIYECLHTAAITEQESRPTPVEYVAIQLELARLRAAVANHNN